MSEFATPSHHEFETPSHTQLYVEIGRGSVTVAAEDTEHSSVTVAGDDADQVSVSHQHGEIRVLGPSGRTGFFRSEPSYDVRIVVPTGTEVATRTGSADVTITGAVGTSQLRTGSGEINAEALAGPAQIESGSGDIKVGVATAGIQIKSGSGDIRIDQAGAATAISTGSGDTHIGTAAGPVAVKSGSGDLALDESREDVAFSTGSGDLLVGTTYRGKVSAKGASGDVQIGVASGVPVWTDISTLTGDISSDLAGAGEPEPGADYLEIRTKSVSGDVVLRER